MVRQPRGYVTIGCARNRIAVRPVSFDGIQPGIDFFASDPDPEAIAHGEPPIGSAWDFPDLGHLDEPRGKPPIPTGTRTFCSNS
ncbi:hypothetical protein [Streptomyces sp. NPDC055632]